MWPLLNSLPRSPTLKKHLCSISVVSTLFCAHLFENTVTVLSLSLSLLEFAVREIKKWRKCAQMLFLSLSLSLSLSFQLQFSLSSVPLLLQRRPLLHVSMSFFFGFIYVFHSFSFVGFDN